MMRRLTLETTKFCGIGATYQLLPEAQLYGGVYRAFLSRFETCRPPMPDV